MKNFKKKMLLAFLIAMTANTSYGGKIKKNSKEENEFIILGTYQKLENTFNKNNIQRHLVSINPLGPEAPEKPINPTDSDGFEGNIPDSTPLTPVTPETPLIPKVDVVKESGEVVARKFFYGENLSYNTSGNITTNNEEALWMTDKNTVVVNNDIVESSYTTTNANLDQQTVHVDDYAKFINNGTVGGINATGVYLNNHSSFENTASGIINNASDYGVIAVNNSSAVNDGHIQNAGEVGMAGYSGSSIENAENGIIENTGFVGMMIEDSGSLAINRGIIRNSGAYGMWVSHGTGENYGTIQNNFGYGAVAFDGGRIDNYGLIKNNGQVGMSAHLGATAVNQASGIISNTGSTGMNVVEANGLVTTAINNGLIANTGDYGMKGTGANGSIINNGTIRNLGTSGMSVTQNALAINTGIIENRTLRGMEAYEGSTAINEGKIQNKGAVGMVAESGSSIENKESGLIANDSVSGMISRDVGTTSINRGIINNNGMYGMWSGNGAIAKNYGIIQNKGIHGMILVDKGRIENYGTVQNTGDNGMIVYTEGIGINQIGGIISNTGNNGMFTVGILSTAINNGTIKNLGDVGMGGTGSVINNGLIEIMGNNKKGISASGAGTTVGIAINNGTILMHGTNNIGMYASGKSTIINQGTITLDGTGTGMSAVGGSHIVLGANSIINIGTQTQTYDGTETSADGFYIKTDATSDVNNQGAITSNTRITIDGTGKFILNSATGSLQATRLVLQGNLYVGAEDTLNSSDDKFIMNNLNIGEITGDGGIVSNSPLFTLAIETTEDNDHAIVMERRSFTDAVSGDLGVVLEKNYKNSENNEKQNKVYNSLKKVTNEKVLLTAEKELTGDSLVNNQTYQLYNQDKIISNGIDKLMDRRTEGVDNGIYVNFLGSKTKAKTENEYSGYDGKSAGVVLGGMKRVGDSTSVGGFLGYLNTNADYADNDNKQNLQTWSLTGAINKELTDELIWKNRVNYNYGMNESERGITYDNSNRTVKGDFNSWSAGAATELEYSKKINDIVTLRPTAGIAIDYLSQEGYTEKGADELNLRVDSNNSTSTRVGAGIRADVRAYKGKRSTLIITPRADYSYELGNPYGDKNVQISAFNDRISMTEREAGKNYLNAGLDVEYKANEKFSLYGGYDTDVLSENKGYNVTAGFKYKF